MSKDEFRMTKECPNDEARRVPGRHSLNDRALAVNAALPRNPFVPFDFGLRPSSFSPQRAPKSRTVI
jgi:hypothetical protein